MAKLRLGYNKPMTAKGSSYQNLSQELDEVLAKLQSSDLDIDEAIKTYERGVVIAKAIENYLKTAENKIAKIKTDWDKSNKLQK